MQCGVAGTHLRYSHVVSPYSSVPPPAFHAQNTATGRAAIRVASKLERKHIIILDGVVMTAHSFYSRSPLRGNLCCPCTPLFDDILQFTEVWNRLSQCVDGGTDIVKITTHLGAEGWRENILNSLSRAMAGQWCRHAVCGRDQCQIMTEPRAQL